MRTQRCLRTYSKHAVSEVQSWAGSREKRLVPGLANFTTRQASSVPVSRPSLSHDCKREDIGQCFGWHWADHQVVESRRLLVCILGTTHVGNYHVKCEYGWDWHKRVGVRGGPFRVCMQAEVTAALINAATSSRTFSPSTWSADCVCANLVSSFHLNLGLPLPQTIGLVSAQPRAQLILGLSASPATTTAAPHQHRHLRP
jgi:hypothetical protein